MPETPPDNAAPPAPPPKRGRGRPPKERPPGYKGRKRYKVPQKIKCRAKSKQNQRQCNHWAMGGVDLCHMHGGRQRGKPRKCTTKTGEHSQFVEKKLVESLTAQTGVKTSDTDAVYVRIQELKSAIGKADAALLGAVLVEQRLAKVPDDPEHLEKFVAGLKSRREDLKLAHELTEEKEAPKPTTFVIGNFDPAQAAPFQGRCPEGPCTVRYLEGQAFMLDAATGGWMPCSEHTDEESGAKYFQRLLSG